MKVVRAKATTLAAPFAANDTSFTLGSFVDSKGNALALSAFGSFLVVVLKQGDTFEMVKCSAITQNANGSATFTVATNGRDLDPTSPYAGHSTGEDFQTGADALVTNDPLTMSMFAVLENDQTFTGNNTFTQKVGVGAVTSSDTGKAATVDLVNSTALSGAPDASTTVKGVSKLSVAPVTPTSPIAVGDNDSRVSPVSLASVTANRIAALAGTGTPSSTDPYLNLSTLTGAITMWGGTAAPTGWLLCDGSAVSRSTYAALFAVLSTTYGVGDGSTTFNLPDLRGRVGVGKNTGTFSALGGTGGEETHTLTVTEMPAHTHQMFPAGANGAGGSGTSAGGGSGGVVNTASTGGGAAHNNLPPYLVLNHIVKY